jgi:hypothetical protein
VWEYISPYKNKRNSNMVYRAYRVPYEWVPQLEKPAETAIEPIDVADFRLPGAAPRGPVAMVEVEGTVSYGEGALCVARIDEVQQLRKGNDDHE